MRAILVAPDAAQRAAIERGEVTATIRYGLRDASEGELAMLCCHLEPWCVQVRLDHVHRAPLGGVPVHLLRRAGYASAAEARDAMRRYYDRVELTSTVTVLAWSEASGKLVDDARENFAFVVSRVVGEGFGPFGPLTPSAARSFDLPAERGACPKCGSTQVCRRFTVAWINQCTSCGAAWSPQRAAKQEFLGLPVVEAPGLACPRCKGTDYFVLAPTSGDPVGTCGSCGPFVLTHEGARVDVVVPQVAAEVPRLEAANPVEWPRDGYKR